MFLCARWNYVQFPHGMLWPRIQEVVHCDQVFRRLWRRHLSQTAEGVGRHQNWQSKFHDLTGSASIAISDFWKVNVIIFLYILLLQDPSKIPGWLNIVKNYYPDFIIRDPEVRPFLIRPKECLMLCACNVKWAWWNSVKKTGYSWVCDRKMAWRNFIGLLSL